MNIPGNPLHAHQIRSLPFSIVDVFTDRPLEGNPLAVISDADALSDDIMKRIAREFNQSETTFLLKPSLPEAHWRLRSFTASGFEVFGAGHNALGAWWWLAKSERLELDNGHGFFQQQIGDSVLPVKIDCTDDLLAVTMYHKLPVYGMVQRKDKRLAEALGVRTGDISSDLAIQTVSTGVAHLLVPLCERSAVDRIKPNAEKLVEILTVAGAQGCYAFSLDPMGRGAHAYARFFNPTAGIWEDPATGSAAGPLACYLQAHGIRSSQPDFVIEQGHLMGRPSCLRVSLEEGQVALIGRCALSSSGTIFLDQR